MKDSEIVAYLAKHFVVRHGANADKNQYGHLELWWAAGDVARTPDSAVNPMLCLGAAENSYSLSAMGNLRALIDAARDNYNKQQGK